jgi:hypothetical protein
MEGVMRKYKSDVVRFNVEDLSEVEAKAKGKIIFDLWKEKKLEKEIFKIVFAKGK